MKPWAWSIVGGLLVVVLAGMGRSMVMIYDMNATQRAVMFRLAKVETRQDIQESRIQAESREAEQDLKEHRARETH